MEGSERVSGDPRRLEDIINDQSRGFISTIGNVTLVNSAASTSVSHYGCSSNSAVFLMPLNAAAASEYVAGTTWVTPAKGGFTINHPSNATARMYRYVFFSGIRA